MPITVEPSSHGASLISLDWHKPATDAKEVLECACQSESKECLELLKSSFDSIRSTLLPQNNGLVDVWFAILAQLSTYINKHAEELRGKFVAHEGQKKLEIVFYGNRYSVDFGEFARQMSLLLEKNVVDSELREWMMPAFTTTTKHDTVIAFILMMGAMQKYFSYRCRIMCGLPSVTLLGEKADWELILARLEKLRTFGEEPALFYQLLKPIISRFVRMFEDPTSEDVVDFWQRIAGFRNGMSGITMYSGWITAFCFWDEDGNSLYDLDRQPWQKEHYLCLDGTYYHQVNMDHVPPGWTKVPVEVDDNGCEFDALMIAGSVAINCTSSGEEVGNGAVGLDTMTPETGWWMFQKVSQPAVGPQKVGLGNLPTDAAATSTPAVKNKRWQSFFGSFGEKMEKKNPSSESSGKGLTGLFRKINSAAKEKKAPASFSKNVPPVPATTEVTLPAADEPITNGVKHKKATQPVIPETTSTTQPASIQASV
ncbi:hypothetical protein MMC30_007601 [Trapelia coarctata]|nr:hypothetical protein [Trapelia coarctata]